MPRSRNTLQRLTLCLGLVLLMATSAAAPRPAHAQFATISNTIVDVPRTIFQFVDKIKSKIAAAFKVSGDIAFKSSLEIFQARLLQEVQTQLATVGPGQQPLFLTHPKKFFKNVSDAAAGDFIDDFARGVTGDTGPGTATSGARGTYLISRLLRAQAGQVVGGVTTQCKTDCNNNFSVGSIDLNSVKNMTAKDFKSESPNMYRNIHEQRVLTLSFDIAGSGGIQSKVDSKAGDGACPDVSPIPSTGPTYPWVIALGQSFPGPMPPEACLGVLTQLILNERSLAQSETNQCIQNCQTRNDAATNAINGFTATDIFSAVKNANARQAPAAVANALSNDKSDIGALLSAAGALTATVQERVLGEQTNLNPNILPVTTKVSDTVKSPSTTASTLLGIPFVGQNGQFTYTGSSVADVLKGVASFLNSPVGKALTNYFKSKCGLNPDLCKGPSNAKSTIGQLVFGSGGPTGVAGAKLLYATLGQADIKTGNPGQNEISITDQLTTSGLIDANFRQAIEETATVQEAIDKGYLDKQKTFGFDKNGLEPTNGYPFRALQYLRKFRVTPVGWELAAKYSQLFDHRDLSLGYLIQRYNTCGQEGNKVCSRGQKSDQSCQVDSDCGTDDNGATISCGASPYCGLVDPNWVLKAPQTFCRRQGAGEEVIAKEFVCDQNNVDASTGLTIAAGVTCDPKGEGTCTDIAAPNCVASSTNPHPDIGRWVIERNSDTCADAQSCIKENDDGTCLAYGYCVQERQQFKFDGTQCAVENSSCAAYTNSLGQEVAYLQNTLDSRNCNADNAGCTAYCAQPSYNPATQQCNGTDTINFTGKVQRCDETQAGCSQFLQTTEGANVLANGGFEYFDQPINSTFSSVYPSWTKNGGIGTFAVTSDDAGVPASNRAAIRLSGAAGDSIVQTINTGYDLYERSFTFSVRAKATSACSATLQLAPNSGQAGHPQIPANAADTNMDVTTDWATYAVTLSFPTADVYRYSSPTYELLAGIRLGGCAANQLVIDSAQLEAGVGATQYKEYGTTNALYLNSKRVSCTAADVGCQGYTPTAGGSEIYGQILDSNRCSADKVGCANFTLEPITGVPPRSGGQVQIVAPKGQICSAADVGCEEYTNLDEVARGGEGKEYFKSVKQCLKPSQVQPADPTSPATSATYYTWVGDAKLGYVLRSYDLVKSDVATAPGQFAPCTNLTIEPVGQKPRCDDGSRIDTSAICNAANFANNPDCAQYYDSALVVYYRLRSKTVTITDDCHPYRNTVDQGGTRKDLVYYLSTKENLTCSAQAAGCRAYTGNASGTTRQVMNDTFESNGTANWVGGEATNASVNVGGHSMLIRQSGPSSASVTKDGFLKNQFFANRSYMVSFTAAATNTTTPTLQVKLGTLSGTTFTPDVTLPGSAVVNGWNENITPPGPEWHTYTLGPIVLPADLPNAQLAFVISAGGDAYVDNVVLTEVNDHVYLISTNVPQCSAAEVGCSAYKNRKGSTDYLTSFNRLCSEQVVGCEAMIDTRNSTTPAAQTVKGVTTPADTVVTMVNNPATYCSAASKGCTAVGQAIYAPDQKLIGYQSVYLINDPDRHSADICRNEELSCQAYTTSSNTTVYFKDPGQQVCDYRTGGDGAGQWYITGTTTLCPTVTPPLVGRPVGASCAAVCRGRCSLNTSLTCTQNADCGSAGGTCNGGGDRLGKTCQTNTDCPGATATNGCTGDVSQNGNIDDGSGHGIVGQCSTNADCSYSGNTCVYVAGSCSAQENGCTEYRDPTDPVSCRSECPLSLSLGGSADMVDGACKRTQCQDGDRVGQNCHNDADCTDDTGQHTCIGGDGQQAVGLPGCRSYYYLRQSIETNSGACNGQVDTAIGCRPFNDTTNPNLNFRGQ